MDRDAVLRPIRPGQRGVGRSVSLSVEGLVLRFGGVVVSGNVNSPMPAWSNEVGGALTLQQVDALTALVESWAKEAGERPVEEVPNTVEAGQEVYSSAGCVGCHGADLKGSPPTYPSLLNLTDRLTTPEIRAVLVEGSGRMPGFERLGAEALSAIQRYLLTGDPVPAQEAYRLGLAPIKRVVVAAGHSPRSVTFALRYGFRRGAFIKVARRKVGLTDP